MSNPHGVTIQFYTDTVEMTAESEAAGKPVYKDVPHIRKLVPGDKNNIIERVAKEFDFESYPQEWEEYQNQIALGTSGLALEDWPIITRAQAKEARYYEINTVEQMANLSDAACQRLGIGFVELRAKAKAHLEVAEVTAEKEAQDAENMHLRNEIEELKALVRSLKPVDQAPAKRGRPAVSEQKPEGQEGLGVEQE